MRMDCSECRRLWDEFASIVREHVGLEAKLRLATARGASAQMQGLIGEVHEQKQARDRLRQAIRAHAAVAHNEG